MTENIKQKCGYVSFIGETNVGKSTLINTLVGEKISIVTHKVQTTRNKIIGIKIINNSQIIFVDTPGMFKAKDNFDKSMIKTSLNEIGKNDVLCVLISANKGITDISEKLIKKVINNGLKFTVIINKIDLVDKVKLIKFSEYFKKYQASIENLFYVSALKNKGVQEVLNFLEKSMPNSNFLFNKEQITDLPNKIFTSEITREKVLKNLNQEIPYEITVYTDLWEKFNNGSIKIKQSIITSKKSHKKIILGHKGCKIKKIGRDSRLELENIFGTKIHLFLEIFVKKNWKNEKDYFNYWGIENIND